MSLGFDSDIDTNHGISFLHENDNEINGKIYIDL